MRRVQVLAITLIRTMLSTTVTTAYVIFTIIMVVSEFLTMIAAFHEKAIIHTTGANTNKNSVTRVPEDVPDFTAYTNYRIVFVCVLCVFKEQDSKFMTRL